MKKHLLLVFAFFLILTGKTFSQNVYITQLGKYYHTAHCKKIDLSHNSPIPLWKAQGYGKFPCPECKPPTGEAKAVPKKGKGKKTKKPVAAKPAQPAPKK